MPLPPAKVRTEPEYVTPPKPIVPKPDVLNLREIEFIVVTPENAEEVFANLDTDKALIALTDEGYEKLSLNIGDIRALVQQYKTIISVYEKQWDEAVENNPENKDEEDPQEE
jgi:hypothetical protein